MRGGSENRKNALEISKIRNAQTFYNKTTRFQNLLMGTIKMMTLAIFFQVSKGIEGGEGGGSEIFSTTKEGGAPKKLNC